MANSLKEEFQNVEVINNFIPDSKNPAVKIGDYFIFAGVVTENKGIFRLIDVFSGIDKRLIIVGTGDAEARAKALIAAKDINNIEMVGWKNHEELFKLIASAQALIIPSIWPENNPLIGLESLSLGTPVIGSTWGGIPEIVEKVDKQLVFRDLSHLVKIIHSFDRKNYPPAGIKKLYQQHFSQEIFFKKYFNLIKTAKNEIK